MKTRTKYYAVIFDPSWTLDEYRYEVREVRKCSPDSREDNADPNYVYSDCGNYYAYGSNILFASSVREISIAFQEIRPIDELHLLDTMENNVRNKAEEALAKALDPIMARKHELAMLTYQATPEPESLCEGVDAEFAGHPFFNPESEDGDIPL